MESWRFTWAGLMDSLNLTPIDRAWATYMETEAKWVEADAAADKLIGKSGELRKGVDWDDYRKLHNEAIARMNTKFTAFDYWNTLRKREADTTRSNVPESDVKSLVSEALSESAGELQFSLNVGLVAHKLTAAVLRFTVREDAQDTPLCAACA